MRGFEFLEKLTDIEDELVEKAQRMPRKTSYVKCLSLVACVLLVAFGTKALLHSEEEMPLPMLYISEDGSGGMGFEGYLAYDISELTNANPWHENLEITNLPVFQNALTYNDRQQVENADLKKMKAILVKEAKSLGMDVKRLPITDDGPSEEDIKSYAKQFGVAVDDIPKEFFYVQRLFMEDDRYRLEVDAALTTTLEVKQHIKMPNDLLEAGEILKGSYSKYLGMKSPQTNISDGDYDIYGHQNFSLSFFEGDTDAVQNILNYHFTRVYFYFNADDQMWLSRKYRTDLSNVIGNYPIISSQEALLLLEKGYYVTTVPEDFPGIAFVRKVELVYKTGRMTEIYMPYYKFYLELPTLEMDNGLKTYGAYYVPAVQSQYIENMPVWEGSFN